MVGNDLSFILAADLSGGKDLLSWPRIIVVGKDLSFILAKDLCGRERS